MKKLCWRIRGYDSLKPIFERTVELGQFTENQIGHLLMVLAAKAGLSYEEIVGAYAKRKTKIANDFLVVHRDPKYPSVSCGLNPHFVASVVDENGKITPFSEEERAELAGSLIGSLDATVDEAEAAWNQEIGRRIENLDSGKAKTIPWEEVRSRISSKLTHGK
jgi:putative addiction module component (TIGR02574 family)